MFTIKWVQMMVARFLWSEQDIPASEWFAGPIDKDRTLAIRHGLTVRITTNGTIMMGGCTPAQRKGK